MVAVFAIWIVELIAHRWGASYLKRRGLKSHDPHSSKGGNEISHTPHGQHVPETTEEALARQDEIERIRTIQEGGGADRGLSRTPSGEVTGKLVDLEDGLAGSDSNKGSTLASPTSEITAPTLNDNSHSHSHSHSHGHSNFIDESSFAQLLGVLILEFGIVFHSFIIGLTLAVNAEFVPLFCVLIL